MRVSINRTFELTDDGLALAKQLGVEGVCFVQPRTPEDRYALEDLVGFRQHCERFGLRLESIEGIPAHLYEKVMLGEPGRDQQIEAYQRLIRNVGSAGIEILAFHWLPNFVWRTSSNGPLRGGAWASSFDYELVRDAALTHGRRYTADEMYANFEYFIDAVLPVAEESGVRLALHPDDPPSHDVGGIARIFSSFEAFRDASERWPSRSFSLLFCLGTFSEMGPGAADSLRYFVERDRVAYVHMRDVQGHVPKFQECFLGDGNVDVVGVMRMLHELGFEGCVIDDHSPRVLGDPDEWPYRGQAWSTGYLLGLAAAIKGERPA